MRIEEKKGSTKVVKGILRVANSLEAVFCKRIINLSLNLNLVELIRDGTPGKEWNCRQNMADQVRQQQRTANIEVDLELEQRTA